jgi:hypothetical protein
MSRICTRKNASLRIFTWKNSNCCYFVFVAKPAYRIKKYKHPRLKYVVRSKISGKWERKFFQTKAEAETYVQQKDIELLNQDGKECSSHLGYEFTRSKGKIGCNPMAKRFQMQSIFT